ncbi:MAG TPA: 4-hydroxy-3-methylbut-2-enyl diphosphate reductase [Streptosporangiaceae bacterium]|nr:4-hydroxy-3-methylbut-2-enyl diphosphate reductase [Streptosporangiaceae bacterium]
MTRPVVRNTAARETTVLRRRAGAGIICAPLRVEAEALRLGLRGHSDTDAVDVIRTGYGTTRSATAAAKIAESDAPMMAVGGVAGALTDDLNVGDVVVATQVSESGAGEGQAVCCPSAPLLAGELRRAGLTVRLGPMATVSKLADSSAHADLAAAGIIAVDMESAQLLGGAGGRPAVVVRAISDTPAHPLVSPHTVTGGLAALRSLRLAAPALARWAAAVGPRQVLLASPRSFCAGVERAIEIVELTLGRHGPPVYVRKQIVHNTAVVARLEQLGAIFVDELSEVPDGATVVFSAHGVAPEVRNEASRRGLDTVDATCPLVAKVHAEARRFAGDGYLVALIGHGGHEEVEGTLGEAPGSTALIETMDDVDRLAPRDPGKVAYLMQTTLAADEASGMVDAILDRFPQAKGPGSDDICYATTNRQRAVRAIAAESDLVLVAGSANSSNSLRLVETAQRAGTPAYLVDSAQDIELGWLAGVSTVGLAAGASAPPAMVSEIMTALSGLGPIQSKEVVVATESVQFGLPRELRQ